MAADGSVVIEILGDESKFKKTLGSLGSLAGTALKGMTTAVVGATTAMVGLAGAAVNVGSEFETSFAQVETIMDTSAVSTGDMKNAIMDLSNQMGISAAQLSGTVYNAISATGDTANAVSLVADASKLATAGFTDTDSALSVLTTTINAYGMSAKDASKISDSLITVQNLGVTTIDQLAGSMGKAIATASAYSVNLGNLESSYVSLTKAGISTDESTTYLSSMMNELGSSGSAVAEIIQSKTGKSFGELMDSGYSLGDVLGILNDACDGNSQALMNLWGSAEAGKAANAIVSQGLDTFNDNLNQIQNSTGATESAYGTMCDTLSHQTELLKTNITNLGISIFDGLESPLKDAAEKANGWIGEISGALKDGGLSAAVKAAGNVLAELVTYAAGAAPQMIDAGVQLLQSLLSGVQENLPELAQGAVGIVTSLVKGIVTLLPQITETALQLIVALANGIVTALPELIPQVVSALGMIAQTLLENIPLLLAVIPQILQSITQSLSGNMPQIVEAGVTAIAGFAASLRENCGAIVDAALELITVLADGLIDSLPVLIENLPQIVIDIAGCINDNAPKLIETAAILIGKLAVGLIEAIPVLVENIPKIIEALVAVWTAFNWISLGKTAITAIKEGVLAMVESVKSAAGSVLDGVTGKLGELPFKLAEIGRNGITGIINAFKGMLSSLSGAAKTVLDTVVTGLKTLPSKVLEIGKQVINGLIDGLKSGINAVGKAVGNVASGIVDKFKQVLGIHSPSKVFAELGNFTVAGFAKGFEDNKDSVLEEASTLSDELADALSVDANTQFNAELNGIYHKMRAAVDTEVDTISTNAAVQAESAAGGTPGQPEPFDPAGVITEIRQLKAQVAKGSTIVMDKKVVAQTVTTEQERANRAAGK